jgi:transposase-like protein
MAGELDGVRVVCPRARHGGATVVRKGFKKDARGRRWQRYQCRLASGGHHYFRVLVDDAGAAVTSVTLPARCPDHADSRVVRNGSYGKSVKRQRYRCTPTDGTAAHFFTLPLPREHLNFAEQKCPGCAEFVSVHKGGEASSRRSKFSLRAVVECLVELSQGTSYAQTSLNLWAKTKAADDHAASHDPAWTGGTGTGSSGASDDAKNAWHLAADVVEQYAPVLYAHTIAQVHAREAQQRVVNDAVLAAGQVVSEPITFLLDEVPIYLKRKGSPSRQAWTVLAVAEVRWKPGPTPMDVPRRDTRLRLARAMPGVASEETWLLVLDELGVVPDAVVADFGSAIKNALDTHWGSTPLRVPSLFHIAKNLREMLRDTPGYSNNATRTRKPLPDLDKHVSRLSRNDLLTWGVQGWSDWWDEFEQLAVTLGVPVTPISNRREVYEAPVAAAIPVLVAQPFLPASNAGIELKNRTLLKPLLHGRQQRYRNIARTNALLDLLVCRENGMFLNTDQVAQLIRDDNLQFGGWSTRRRSFDDPQPPVLTASTDTAPRYASLLDTGLVTVMLAAKATP